MFRNLSSKRVSAYFSQEIRVRNVDVKGMSDRKVILRDNVVRKNTWTRNWQESHSSKPLITILSNLDSRFINQISPLNRNYWTFSKREKRNPKIISTNSIPKIFQKHGDHDHISLATSNSHETKTAVRITIFGMFTNITFTIGKAVVGYLANSSALVADAVHSASDLASDAVTLWAIKIARRPHDSNHLYGHGRFESVGTLFVGGFLVAAAFGIVDHAYEHFQAAAVPSQLAFYTAVAALITKEILFQVKKSKRKKHSHQTIGVSWLKPTTNF